jgi:endogenous inhibitor of DNA gyrase (YacG/DUF329 family)
MTNMPMTVACPACSRTVNVPDELVGEQVKCPLCGQQFKVEHEREARPAAEPLTMTYAPKPEEAAAAQEAEGHDAPPWEFTPSRRRDLEPHRGTVILVLGILSICLGMGCIGIILGPIAWSMGAADLRAIRQGRMDPAGMGTTKAGYTCGIVGTILSAITMSGCFGLQMLNMRHWH